MKQLPRQTAVGSAIGIAVAPAIGGLEVGDPPVDLAVFNEFGGPNYIPSAIYNENGDSTAVGDAPYDEDGNPLPI